MRILLDESLPLDFRHSFPNHDAHTTQWAGLKTITPGQSIGRQSGETKSIAHVDPIRTQEIRKRTLTGCRRELTTFICKCSTDFYRDIVPSFSARTRKIC